jgi:hypothetical protein
MSTSYPTCNIRGFTHCRDAQGQLYDLLTQGMVDFVEGSQLRIII